MYVYNIVLSSYTVCVQITFQPILVIIFSHLKSTELSPFEQIGYKKVKTEPQEPYIADN